MHLHMYMWSCKCMFHVCVFCASVWMCMHMYMTGKMLLGLFVYCASPLYCVSEFFIEPEAHSFGQAGRSESGWDLPGSASQYWGYRNMFNYAWILHGCCKRKFLNTINYRPRAHSIAAFPSDKQFMSSSLCLSSREKLEDTAVRTENFAHVCHPGS